MKKAASGRTGVRTKLPRTLADLGDPGVRVEPVHRVEGARVVLANYALLQEDFPELRRLSRKTIDQWLIRNAAVVSEVQAAQSDVNSTIATNGTSTAYRPPLYGRALVVPVEGADGLLDLKGTGVAPGRKATPEAHSNGLLSLGEALANIAFRELIELIFRSAGTQFRTVPEYGVLDLGYDVRGLLGAPTPAAVQVRQAHCRPVGGVELPLAGSPEQQVKLEIELLLRHYGVTSTSPATSFVIDDGSGTVEITYAGKPIPPHPDDQIANFLRLAGYDGGKMILEGVNVQLTRASGVRPSRASVIDFGHYSVHERFEHTLVSLVRDRSMRWGGSVKPDAPHFVQPQPLLSASVEEWGTPEKCDPRFAVPGHPELIWPEPFVAGFELAHAFRDGSLDSKGVRAQLDAMTASLARRWKHAA
jgi:hypothetical protein